MARWAATRKRKTAEVTTTSGVGFAHPFNDHPPTAQATHGLQRYSRRTRWFHTLVYLTTFVLFATGGWLFVGREGSSSPLARVFRISDVELHIDSGWVLAALGALALLVGIGGTRAFFRASFRYDKGDPAWFKAWPKALFTGRFSDHRGHFDPGQRVANLAIVLLLVALVISGFVLIGVSGGPAFEWALRVHKWATLIALPIIVGHVIVASGIFPGYRGVWRSIHWRGEIDATVARRLWPAWTDDEINAGSTDRRPRQRRG